MTSLDLRHTGCEEMGWSACWCVGAVCSSVRGFSTRCVHDSHNPSTEFNYHTEAGRGLPGGCYSGANREKSSEVRNSMSALLG